MGNHFAPFHAAGHAHHVAGVCEHHAVEAHFPLQKVCQQLFRERGRHDVVVPDAGIHRAGVAGQHDVAGHDGFKPVVDEVCINFAERGVPFLAGERVHAVCHVLVAVVQTVAGEVLCRAAEAGHLVRAFQIRLCHFQYALGVIAVGAQAHHGIVPVVVNVRNRRKAEVAANGRSLGVGHLAQRLGVFYVARGTDLCLCANVRAVHAGTVAAVFGVAGDNEGDLGIFLQDAVLLVHLGCGGGIVANAADVIFVHRHLQIFLGAGGTHVKKQLADFFFGCHGGDGILYPLDAFVVQIIGFRAQIYRHLIKSFLFSIFARVFSALRKGETTKGRNRPQSGILTKKHPEKQLILLENTKYSPVSQYHILRDCTGARRICNLAAGHVRRGRIIG